MAKPRKFTPGFKAKIALAAVKGDKPIVALCREHQLSATVVICRRQLLIVHGTNIFAAQTPTQHDQQGRAATQASKNYRNFFAKSSSEPSHLPCKLRPSN